MARYYYNEDPVGPSVPVDPSADNSTLWGTSSRDGYRLRSSTVGRAFGYTSSIPFYDNTSSSPMPLYYEAMDIHLGAITSYKSITLTLPNWLGYYVNGTSTISFYMTNSSSCTSQASLNSGFYPSMVITSNTSSEFTSTTINTYTNTGIYYSSSPGSWENGFRFRQREDGSAGLSGRFAPYMYVSICSACSKINICGNNSSGSCTNNSSNCTGCSAIMTCGTNYRAGKCNCCLSKDTKILLTNGKIKTISNLKVGDTIYAIKDNKYKETKVKFTYIAFPKIETKLYSLELENGKIIEITGLHPIACEDGAYKTIEASNTYKTISIGEKLVNNHKIINITTKILSEPVYNILTEDDNFVVEDVALACEDEGTKYFNISYSSDNTLGADPVGIKVGCGGSLGD